MTKSRTILFVVFFLFILSLVIALTSNRTSGEGRYQAWVKTTIERYPIPLGKNKTVFDWWPLKDNLEYKYKIRDSRWEFGKKWVGAEFTLRIIKDEENESKFYFHIEGFDEFPYTALVIRENRIFILSKYAERPFIVFPLFKHMLFADERYEHEFLKKTILNTSEKSFYAPVWTEFWRVTKSVENIYHIEEVCPRGLRYKFEKNVGIIEWLIPGGYTIELIRSERPF